MYILALTFFVISVLFSMIGMGGGILYVPILLFAGFSMQQAPSISLVLILATSLAALYKFSKNKKVDWKLAAVIDPPTDIMAFVGGYFSGLISENYLRVFLIFILIIAGIFMLRKPNNKGLRPVNKKHWWIWHREFSGEKYSVNLPLVLFITASIGLFSGMLGITGGVIKLPLMVLLCGVPMDIAIATSTVMVAVTALSGIIGHAVNSHIEWKIALLLAIASIIGGLIGSHISLKVNKVLLKRWFGIVVFLIAIRISIQLILGFIN